MKGREVATLDGEALDLAGRGRLDGPVCVVAGIGGVIGSAVAERFAAEGASVVGIDRQAVQTRFPVLEADLSDEEATREAFLRIRERYGPLHVLHVNAGPVDREDHSLLVTPSEVWHRVFAAIVMPTVHCCRFGVEQMDKDVGGSVILTGSFLAGMGSATAQMAFNAAKAAVTQIGRDLGMQLARSNIRVNTIALGPVETPEIREMFERIGPEQTARRLRLMPLGRFATLDEVASAAVHLASAESGYTTASVLRLDGGIQRAYTIPE